MSPSDITKGELENEEFGGEWDIYTASKYFPARHLLITKRKRITLQ